MGIRTHNQHDVARPYCTGLSHSIFQPLPSSCISYLRRGELRKRYMVNTATARQARRGGTVSKSNFIEPKWMLAADDKAGKGVAYQRSNEAVFEVVLITSKDYGSGISDLNAGILLAFIGEQGRCFVCRILALMSTETIETSGQTRGLCASRSSHYRFQRGSQDVITFCGPDLGELEAVWLAPEKSTWRIQGMSVRVSPKELHSDRTNINEDTDCKALQYDFVCEDFLIGGNDNNLAAELKPSKVSNVSHGDQILSVSKPELEAHLAQLRDEGIREYEALKFSLLGYDGLLVTLGSAVAAAMGYKEVAEGYLVGGVLGFLYLFVLEKAVDQLPAPSPSTLLESNDRESLLNNSPKVVEGRSNAAVHENGVSSYGKNRSLDRFRGPLTKFSGILAVSLLILKSLNHTTRQAISKHMLLSGAAGFLMTKFATILASNMPISLEQAQLTRKSEK